MLTFAIALASTILTAPPGSFPEGFVPQLDPEVSRLAEPYREAEVFPVAARCAADPSGDGCSLRAFGVIGWHADGRVAILEAPEVAGCGPDDMLPGLKLRVGKSVRGGKVTKLDRPNDDAMFAKAWTTLDGLVKEGFIAAKDLRAQVDERVSGIRSHTPLAILGAPLEGWMVYGKDEASGVVIYVVEPDNKTKHVAGRANLGGHHDPTIDHVALSPSLDRLVIAFSASDGSHCGWDPLRIVELKLPPKGAK